MGESGDRASGSRKRVGAAGLGPEDEKRGEGGMIGTWEPSVLGSKCEGALICRRNPKRFCLTRWEQILPETLKHVEIPENINMSTHAIKPHSKFHP